MAVFHRYCCHTGAAFGLLQRNGRLQKERSKLFLGGIAPWSSWQSQIPKFASRAPVEDDLGKEYLAQQETGASKVLCDGDDVISPCARVETTRYLVLHTSNKEIVTLPTPLRRQCDVCVCCLVRYVVFSESTTTKSSTEYQFLADDRTTSASRRTVISTVARPSRRGMES